MELNDTGSQPKCAPVLVQGVPAKAIIDSSSEITIMGAHFFKKVAMTVRFRKRDLKPQSLPHYIRCSSRSGKAESDACFLDTVSCHTLHRKPT